MFSVDRVGLFLVADSGEHLVLKVSKEHRDIRVPMAGIAGAVVQSGELENISNCYEDSRFDPTFDRQTRYKTTSMLCVPIIDASQASPRTIGVLQLINKKTPEGVFDAHDETLAKAVADQLADTLVKLQGALRLDATAKVGAEHWCSHSRWQHSNSCSPAATCLPGDAYRPSEAAVQGQDWLSS